MQPLQKAYPLLLLSVIACAKVSGDAGADASAVVPEPDATLGPVDADIPMQPDADTCPGDPCSILPHCGCSGQVCDVNPDEFETGGLACRDVSDPGDQSANCTFLTECSAGYGCVGQQCRAYCDVDNPCSEEGSHCIIHPSYEAMPGTYEAIPGITVCTKSCSPTLATGNGCPSAPQFGCHLRHADPDESPNSGDEFYHTDCASSLGRGDGEDCSDEGDRACAPGFECVSVGGESVCKELCVVPDGSCEGGRTCNSFADPKPIIGGVEYGICQ